MWINWSNEQATWQDCLPHFHPSIRTSFTVVCLQELITKDVLSNFLWEPLARDGWNDTPRIRSRWWENKGRMKKGHQCLLLWTPVLSYQNQTRGATLEVSLIVFMLISALDQRLELALGVGLYLYLLPLSLGQLEQRRPTPAGRKSPQLDVWSASAPSCCEGLAFEELMMLPS